MLFIKIMLKKIILNVLIILFIFSCRSREYDFSRYIQELRDFNNYDFDINKELSERVADAPEFVMDYLKKFDNRPDYKSYLINDNELQIIEENLSLIPKEYKAILKERLIGIYFIEEFWGSGLCTYAVDSKGDIYTLIFLNPELLNMTLNEAYLKKEKSCFLPSHNYDLKVDISDNYNGILYVLLHELNHAVDYVKGITPYTDYSLLQYREPLANNYETSKFWLDYSILKKQYDFPIFKNITFYGFNDGPKMNLSRAIYLYKTLKKTPFISLYSTMSWAEDLAELKTISYLVNELGCNYQIEIIKDNDVIYTFDPMNNKKVLERL